MIITSILVTAGYVLFAGVTESKYYQQICNKILSRFSVILTVLVLTIQLVLLPIVANNVIWSTVFYGLLWLVSAVALSYGIYFMRNQLFVYKFQRKLALYILRVVCFLFIIMTGGYGYNFYLLYM